MSVCAIYMLGDRSPNKSVSISYIMTISRLHNWFENLAKIYTCWIVVHNKFYDVDVLLSHYTRVLHKAMPPKWRKRKTKNINTDTHNTASNNLITRPANLRLTHGSRQEIPVPRFQVWPFIIVIFFLFAARCSYEKFCCFFSLSFLWKFITKLLEKHKFCTQRQYIQMSAKKMIYKSARKKNERTIWLLAFFLCATHLNRH